MVTGSTLFGVCFVSGIAFEIIFFHLTSLGFTVAWIGGSVSLGAITLIVLGSFCYQFKETQTPLSLKGSNDLEQLSTVPTQTSDTLEQTGEEPLQACATPQEVLEDPHITNNDQPTARDIAKSAATKALLEEYETQEIPSFFEVIKGRPHLHFELIEMITFYLSPKERENFRLISHGTHALDDTQYYLSRAQKLGYQDQDFTKAKDYYKTILLGVKKLNIAIKINDYNSLEELACCLINNPKLFFEPNNLDNNQQEGFKACLKYFAKKKIAL